MPHERSFAIKLDIRSENPAAGMAGEELFDMGGIHESGTSREDQGARIERNRLAFDRAHEKRIGEPLRNDHRLGFHDIGLLSHQDEGNDLIALDGVLVGNLP